MPDASRARLAPSPPLQNLVFAEPTAASTRSSARQKAPGRRTTGPCWQRLQYDMLNFPTRISSPTIQHIHSAQGCHMRDGTPPSAEEEEIPPTGGDLWRYLPDVRPVHHAPYHRFALPTVIRSYSNGRSVPRVRVRAQHDGRRIAGRVARVRERTRKRWFSLEEMSAIHLMRRSNASAIRRPWKVATTDPHFRSPLSPACSEVGISSCFPHPSWRKT
jgi:hypothetical protein